jgi:hypothetical protein
MHAPPQTRNPAGQVDAIWKRPDGTVIEDTGLIPGSGTNFTGLSATQPIGSVTLHRSFVNVLIGLDTRLATESTRTRSALS